MKLETEYQQAANMAIAESTTGLKARYIAPLHYGKAEHTEAKAITSLNAIGDGHRCQLGREEKVKLKTGHFADVFRLIAHGPSFDVATERALKRLQSEGLI